MLLYDTLWNGITFSKVTVHHTIGRPVYSDSSAITELQFILSVSGIACVLL